MKMKMIKMTAGGAGPLLALALLASAGAAHAAGGPVSTVVTASDKAVFAKAGSVTITLTPRTDLMAGTIAGGTLLGTLKIAPSSKDDLPVWRFTPGSGIPVAGSEKDPAVWQIPGTSDPTHKLDLSLIGVDMNYLPGTTWATFFYQQKGTVSTTVKTITSAQQVAPDTYTLSLDAAVWAS